MLKNNSRNIKINRGLYFNENDYFEKELSIQFEKYHSGLDDPELKNRRIAAGKLIMKIALKYLKPKQRKIFYSVWCKYGGDKKLGINEYSKKVNENIITNYITYNLAIKSLKRILKRTRFYEIIENFIVPNEEEFN